MNSRHIHEEVPAGRVAPGGSDREPLTVGQQRSLIKALLDAPLNLGRRVPFLGQHATDFRLRSVGADCRMLDLDRH